MIKLVNVAKDYKTSSGEITKALNKISILFGNKGLISMLGKSGSGKTSLLNVIAGIIKPTSGHIIYDSLNSKDMDESDYDYLRNYYFGFIFQEIYLIDTLTVYENIEISLDLQGLHREEINKKIEDSLSKLGIVNLINKKALELSGGERQRVCIARSIAKGCKVLLADEPTGSLDSENAKIVYEYFKEISKDILVIIVTHDENSAMQYSDTIIRLIDGELQKSHLSSSNEVMALPNKNNINNVLITFKLSRKLNRSQNFRKTFTILFWTISMLVVAFSLNYSTFNSENFIYNAAVASDVNSFKIVDDIYNLDNNQFDISKIDTTKYSSVNFYDYYYTEMFEYQMFRNYNEEILYNNYYKHLVFDTVLIGDFKNNEIVITDFTASMMINYALIDAINVNDCINKEIIYNGITLKIVGITKTDYLDYDKEILDNPDSKEYNKFVNKRSNEYTIVQMSEWTFSHLTPRNTSFNVVINNNNGKILDYKLLEETTPQALLGRVPSEKNEMVVSMAFLTRVLSLEGNIPPDFEVYLEQEYEIKIASDNGNNSYRYKLVGVMYTDEIQMYITNDDLEIIAKDLNINLWQQFDKHIYFKFGNKKDTVNLISDVMSNNGFLSSYISRDIYSVIIGMNANKRITIIQTIFSLLILLLILIYFTNNLIKQNKRNIGILSSLGFSKNNLSLTFIWESLKLLGLVIILVTIINIIGLAFINNNIKYNLKININSLSFNILVILAVLIISIIMILISSLMPITKLRKLDLIDVIYDK